MNRSFSSLSCFLIILISSLSSTHANTFLDTSILGESLGGWTKKGNQAATYEVSGSKYRTWMPTATPTPDGGTFISVRIDHLRGFFANDDHASLELTIDKNGHIISARSSLGLQGKKITSDLIRHAGNATGKATGITQATKIGTDLIADLTSKLLREHITEPGRVTFPAAVQHNYNLICLALWDQQTKGTKEPKTSSTEPSQKSSSKHEEHSACTERKASKLTLENPNPKKK